MFLRCHRKCNVRFTYSPTRSIKFIANGRKRIGLYYDKKLRLQELKDRIYQQIAAVDEACDELRKACKGNPASVENLCHQRFENFFLDDDIPWEMLDVSAKKDGSCLVPRCAMKGTSSGKRPLP